jgi:hypothetical protein
VAAVAADAARVATNPVTTSTRRGDAELRLSLGVVTVVRFFRSDIVFILRRR